MANIFAPGGNELAKQKDLDAITGNNNDAILNNTLPTITSIHGSKGTENLPTEAWGALDTRIANVPDNGTIFTRGGQFYLSDDGFLFYHGYSNNAGGYKSWERIVFNSEVDALRSQIDVLKKQVESLTKNQNGGVTSLLNHIDYATSTVMEVA